jgi:hypothetical protein
MSEVQLSRILSGLSLGVTAYIGFIVASNFSAVYGNNLSWSGGNSFQAALLTAVVCGAVISSAAITYFIRTGKRNWFLILLLAHVWLAIISWVSYLLILIVLGWWFSKYAYTST